MKVASAPRASATLDAVAAVGREIRELLERKRLRLAEDIVHYPTPIPACDADFNHMLAERARLEEEIARLDKLRKQEAGHDDFAGLLAEFAALSPDLDAAAKREIKSALKAAVSRGDH